MLLQLENTNKENIDKLLNFAKENQLKLSVMDDYENNFSLPGKPLSEAELCLLIEKSRRSGQIAMEEGHSIIRKSFNAED